MYTITCVLSLLMTHDVMLCLLCIPSCQPLESVPLTLYHNGLALYQGPFRPYTDPSTRQVIQDLSDGYFPSELQPRYPEGVPLVISDQRDVAFCSRQSLEHFPGSGRLLGGNKGPSRVLLAGSEFRTSPKGMKETSQLPRKPLSAEQLLSRLPQSVVRRGRVVEIRAGIRDRLQVSILLKPFSSSR